MFLHIIVLHEDKLFLHVSTHNAENEKNEKNILLECELINDYASIYKPIRILETLVIYQDCEIDFFVKKYMKYYDIDNVRGGSYTNEILNENERHYILHEQTHNLDINKLQCDIISDLLVNYKDINTWSIDKIKMEYAECKKHHNNYENEKRMLHKFTVGINNILINRVIIADLTWICNQCAKAIKLTPYNQVVDYKKKYVDTAIIKKYKNIVIKLKSIYFIFSNYLDVTNTYQPRIHLYSPETILDQYFYNPNVNTCILHYETLNTFISMCEYMSYCIICRIDEYDFDVNSYSSNFEMSNKYQLTFLEKAY